MTSDTTIVELLSLLSANAHEHAILLIDVEGRVIWANHGASKLLGNLDFLLHKQFANLFSPEDIRAGVPQLEMHVAKVHQAAEDERWHCRCNGARFWASGTMYALRDAQQNLRGFAKIFRDRSDTKAELQYLRSRVQDLEAMQEKLITANGVIAHELRNPVGVLSNIVQMAKTSAKSAQDIAKADLLRKQVEVMSRLIDDLTEVTRLNTGRIDIHKEIKDLRKVISGALLAVQAQHGTRTAALECLLPALPMRVSIDEQRIHQVFVNLLTNAIKYTPLVGHITVHGTTEGEMAVVRIKDTGIGIDPQMMDSIFQMFTRATDVGRKSLGVGLALVREYVTLHGGTVQARSAGVGKGSEFIVRLPLTSPTETENQDP